MRQRSRRGEGGFGSGAMEMPVTTEVTDAVMGTTPSRGRAEPSPWHVDVEGLCVYVVKMDLTQVEGEEELGK